MTGGPLPRHTPWPPLTYPDPPYVRWGADEGLRHLPDSGSGHRGQEVSNSRQVRGVGKRPYSDALTGSI